MSGMDVGNERLTKRGRGANITRWEGIISTK